METWGIVSRTRHCDSKQNTESPAKGASHLVSYVLVIAISFLAIYLAIMFVKPVLDGMHDSSVLKEGLSNMQRLENVLKEVAGEGLGSKRTLQLQVSGGSYMVNNSLSALYYDYLLTSGLLGPRVFVRYGNVWLFTCPVGGKTNLELRLMYQNINITGDSNMIGKGTNQVCVNKTAVGSDNKPVAMFSRC